MPLKYKNEFRIPSARLKNWDYGKNGIYFITICTKNSAHYFGKIIDQKMELNSIGELASQYWLEIPSHFNSIKLGDFVVMPNHIHGILIMNKGDFESQKLLKGGFSGSENPMCKESISKIVRWYKGRCAFEFRKFNSHFEWQTRFYDNIIHDTSAFEAVQNYILENPEKWDKDKFYN